MHERIEATVIGKVQGVSFRNFVREQALALGLRGEVQNLANGTVRVIAEGSRDQLETLVGHLYEGPEFAKVESVIVHRLPAKNEHDTFHKRHERG